MTKEKLLVLLKNKLNSTGKNINGDESDIYGNDKLNSFLDLSLSDFNQTPFFTAYSFEDTNILNIFTEVLVEGAFLHALSSQALIEVGRECTIDDNGVGFVSPNVSNMLFSQFCALYEFHYKKLKDIKNYFSISDKKFQVKE